MIATQETSPTLAPPQDASAAAAAVNDAHNHEGGTEALRAGRYAQCGLLVAVGLLGIVGNVGLAATVLLARRLRRPANAFLVHQCLLDLVKSLYCLLFAASLLTDRAPPHCNLIGSCFVLCVTSAAFNLLGMALSESYALADLTAGRGDSGNCSCVLFGIGTVWFASFILNLGVALLPGSPSYMPRIGHCTFRYGETRNYVLHALWILVVSLALGLTAWYLRRTRADIQDSRLRCRGNCNYSADDDDGGLRRALQQTLHLSSMSPTQPDRHDQHQHQQQLDRLLDGAAAYATTRLHGLLALTAAFVLFWYPLFALTLADPDYHSRPGVYKALTMLACCSCAANPLLLAWLYCRARLPRLVVASLQQQRQQPLDTTTTGKLNSSSSIRRSYSVERLPPPLIGAIGRQSTL